MKQYLAYLCLLTLTGCLGVKPPVQRHDVVGKWQYENTGLLSYIETMVFQSNGVFSYHSSDTIVGLEMTGMWKLKKDRLWLYSDEVKVRGKPEPPEKHWWQSLPSQPLRLEDGAIVLQLEEGKPFKKI